jgi:hypothetical protein
LRTSYITEPQTPQNRNPLNWNGLSTALDSRRIVAAFAAMIF